MQGTLNGAANAAAARKHTEAYYENSEHAWRMLPDTTPEMHRTNDVKSNTIATVFRVFSNPAEAAMPMHLLAATFGFELSVAEAEFVCVMLEEAWQEPIEGLFELAAAACR